MASVPTDSANDICGEVALFWAIVLAMSNLTTVLASLIFIVTEGTVKSGQFAQLVSLELVLTFGNRSGCLDDVVDQLFSFIDLVFCIGHD
jgi:hypothetical protein